MRRYKKRAAPRRRRVRKTGIAANNTKTDLKAVYRSVFQVKTQASSSGVGQYAYYAFSPQNASYTNVTTFSEFNAQKQLYDEFRVVSATLTYRPFYNVIQPTSTTTAGNINLYTVIDRDGGTPVSTAVQVPVKMQSYDSCRIFRSSKGWSRTMKLSTFWTDCGQPTVNPVGGNVGVYQPWTNKGAVQALIMYAENLPVNTGAILGELTFSCKVEYRGKKPVAFGLDPVSGSVIMTPLESYVPLPVFNPPLTLAEVESDEQIACVDGQVVVISNNDDSEAKAAD